MEIRIRVEDGKISVEAEGGAPEDMFQAGLQLLSGSYHSGWLPSGRDRGDFVRLAADCLEEKIDQDQTFIRFPHPGRDGQDSGKV